ncbi:hypothetical protein BDN70DRAFT_882045 [Pholiota conissans]|uniref:Uncharacterized protein n=1 Tax=Pholiota conissans TaxID=109636 RepID=A0A9P5YVZ1_9AGAR|nr:hypothetical protein BDN70DRAFT_882045 [Pholiota conissans]
MVFGFFSRRPAVSTPAETTEPVDPETAEAGPSTNPGAIAPHFVFPAKQQLHTPAPSVDEAVINLNQDDQVLSKPKAKPRRAKPKPKPKEAKEPKDVKEESPAMQEIVPGPIDTPSPTPEEVVVTDPTSLHALIASVPAQTLHAYTLTRLNPSSSPVYPLLSHIPTAVTTEPPTPQILTALTAFFASLAPPPKLHCVRCHLGYFDLENTERSCRVAHDDDSAIVERVGLKKGEGVGYETLWGCCGATVEGDGDTPDGWCYEGAHTTDTKRARFRADSTPQDDKLTSCEKLRCHMPPLPPRSSLGRGSRKRDRKAMDEEEEEEEDSRSVASSHSRSHTRSISTTSLKGKLKETDPNAEEKARPAKRVRSRKPSSANALVAAKSKDDDAMDVDDSQQPSPPKSPQRKSKAAKAKPMTPTPKSNSSASNKPAQSSPLSASFVPGTGSITVVRREESPTRKPKTRVEVELISRGTLSAKSSVGSLKGVKAKGSAASLGAVKVKPKLLGEVVDTSVDGEMVWS